ncbi:MAG: HAMP domain-containing sensor histidine kinase [Candidatus Micrarchaeota archaeon]
MNGAATAKKRITPRELRSIRAPPGVRDLQPILAMAPLLEEMMGVGVGLSIRQGAAGQSDQVYLSPRYQELMGEPTIPLLEDTISMQIGDSVLNLRLLSPDDQPEKLDRLAKMAMVGEVSVGLAHDIRNVLTIIMGNLDLIRRSVPDAKGISYGNRNAADFIADMDDAIAMGMSMCRRIEELGSTRRELSTEDLSAIVQSVVNTVNNRIKNAPGGEGALKITNLATDTIFVRVVSAEVQMAMLNILFNAIRYCGTPDGKGHIIIASESYASHSVLSIWNNGPPIPPQVQEGLLKRPLASATVHGYGLYTAASNLESFGVELSFTSGEDGTEFRMRFPRPERRKPEGPAPASE